LTVDAHRSMRQGWVARAEDEIVLHFLTEFRFQRRGYIDLAQHAKPLLGKRFSGASYGVLERRL
jgi:hypothetical protein